jgi:hypothetical protein
MQKVELPLTFMTAKLSDLIERLPQLATAAQELGGDASGWDWLAPGAGFDPVSPEDALSALRAAGIVSSMRSKPC